MFEMRMGLLFNSCNIFAIGENKIHNCCSHYLHKKIYLMPRQKFPQHYPIIVFLGEDFSDIF